VELRFTSCFQQPGHSVRFKS